MDFDTRARSAAQGINRAVEVMEMSTETKQPRKVERFDNYRGRKNRNRKIGAVAVAAVIAILAAVIALNTVDTSKANRPANKGNPPAGLTSPPTSGGFLFDLTTHLYTPLPASLRDAGSAYAVSPNHKFVAYTANQGSGMFIANIDGTGVRQITFGNDMGPQWSPNGGGIVYQERPADGNSTALGNLFVYSVGTGRSTQITHIDQSTPTNGWWVMAPSFLPDGSVLFQMPRGTSPQFWDLWSVWRTFRRKPEIFLKNAGWGTMNGDGRLAYATPVSPSTFNGGWLVVRNLGQTATPPPSVHGPIIKLRWSPDGTRLSYTSGVGGDVYVLNVEDGSVTGVVKGDRNVGWFDNNTLIVGNGA